ncbi:MAG: NERD domain-containing protein [Mycoplasmataceae bacterium]|nr:NERD domain-containing protein [Mycoplasmataceae bacterium]
MVGFVIGISISLILITTLFFIWIFFRIKKKSKENELVKKGKMTELAINEKLSLWANINDSLFIPATMFKYNNNKIFEVDGILLTTRALICVEVKNINANLIYANGNEKEWVKVIGQNKHLIKSPILQNDKHIDHIVKMTDIKMPIISLIIFDSISTKEIDIKNIPSHVLIIKSNELDTTMEGIVSSLIPKISRREIEKMYEKLMEHQTTSKKDKELLRSFSKEYNEKTFTI